MIKTKIKKKLLYIPIILGSILFSRENNIEARQLNPFLRFRPYQECKDSDITGVEHADTMHCKISNYSTKFIGLFGDYEISLNIVKKNHKYEDILVLPYGDNLNSDFEKYIKGDINSEKLNKSIKDKGVNDLEGLVENLSFAISGPFLEPNLNLINGLVNGELDNSLFNPDLVERNNDIYFVFPIEYLDKVRCKEDGFSTYNFDIIVATGSVNDLEKITNVNFRITKDVAEEDEEE